MTRSGIIIVVRPLAAKVRGSIEVMRSGRVIDVNETQLENAPSPIDVTLLGIVNDVKEIHEKYLQPIITQYFIDNKSEIWLLFLIAHSKR